MRHTTPAAIAFAIVALACAASTHSAFAAAFYKVEVGGNPASCTVCPGNHATLTDDEPLSYGPAPCTHRSGSSFLGAASADANELFVESMVSLGATNCVTQNAYAKIQFDDLIFTGPSGQTTVPVSFTVELDAVLMTPDGSGLASWTLSGGLTGPTSAELDCPGCSGASCCGSSQGVFSITSTAGLATLNVASTFTLDVSLGTGGVSSNGFAHAKAFARLGVVNVAGSVSGPVFNLPPGYTVSSAQMGIVDNHFVDCSAFTEVCNGVDDDCDTLVDEAGPVTVSMNIPGLQGSVTRCISFEVYSCPSSTPLLIEHDVTFTNGSAQPFDLGLPCDATCIVARDSLHSLRQTAQISSSAAGFGAGNALRSGNVNGDSYIDIFDFGGFIGSYNQELDSADTTCTDLPPHPDFSGDGFVLLNDFSFIQINFLESNSPGCCDDRELAGDRPAGPVSSVTVEDLFKLGLGDLAIADLNGDGIVDQLDMAAFAGGMLPPVFADLTADGIVGPADLAQLLAAWGQCPASRACPADLNHDGVVGPADMAQLLAHWSK
jgi:hypothetical protein